MKTQILIWKYMEKELKTWLCAQPQNTGKTLYQTFATKLLIIYKWTESTSIKSLPCTQNTAMISPITIQQEVVTTGTQVTPKCLKMLNKK